MKTTAENVRITFPNQDELVGALKRAVHAGTFSIGGLVHELAGGCVTAPRVHIGCEDNEEMDVLLSQENGDADTCATSVRASIGYRYMECEEEQMPFALKDVINFLEMGIE